MADTKPMTLREAMEGAIYGMEHGAPFPRADVAATLRKWMEFVEAAIAAEEEYENLDGIEGSSIPDAEYEEACEKSETASTVRAQAYRAAIAEDGK